MTQSKEAQMETLLHLNNTLLMKQIVVTPTKANVDIVHHVKVMPTLFSDNIMIELSMYGTRMAGGTHLQRSRHNLSSLNFNKADWKSIQQEIHRMDWLKCLPHKTLIWNYNILCLLYKPYDRNMSQSINLN